MTDAFDPTNQQHQKIKVNNFSKSIKNLGALLHFRLLAFPILDYEASVLTQSFIGAGRD